MSDPVLTSSWCTNWGAFNTPRLWSMVMNEDRTVGEQQADAWRSLADSVRAQRDALVKAKTDLAAAWPPEDNTSATAFVAELDILINRLTTAAADADSTAGGLENIVGALQTARSTIEPLWEEYKDKSTDWTPNWWDEAEDEIDVKARNAMIAAEARIQESVVLLKVPEKYQLAIEDGSGGDPGDPGGGNPTTYRGGPGGGGGGAISASVPHSPPPPLPGQDAFVPDGTIADINTPGLDTGVGSGIGSGVGAGGPDLAGVIQPGQPPVLPGVEPPHTLPGPGPLPSNVGPGPTPPLPGLLPSTGGGGGLVPPGPGGGRGVQRAGVRPAGTPTRLPSGAVIGEGGLGGGRGLTGGAPVGMGGAGRSPARGPGARGAGVGSSGIGGSGVGASGGVGGAGGRGAAPRKAVPRPSWLPNDPVGPDRHNAGPGGMAGAPGRAGRRTRAEDDQAGFDPDNPWEVAEGVEPVILPGHGDARIDPGPNVIGWR
ncbi:hypothetical protein [Paractinoplanes rishiriensis]|uniref:PPE family domain-containing protein n=1 Tax=Paractinoplanes rishiriensis TaxID=1050105 RepID=A0A919K2F3_9ACTN|nr:hypothetical protein [Actinoplanes rishiriensis]GIE99013.1 hypothetical protein Ari01nite_64780 [Actinoplanes rishiriensis]